MQSEIKQLLKIKLNNFHTLIKTKDNEKLFNSKMKSEKSIRSFTEYEKTTKKTMKNPMKKPNEAITRIVRKLLQTGKVAKPLCYTTP